MWLVKYFGNFALTEFLNAVAETRGELAKGLGDLFFEKKTLNPALLLNAFVC